MDDYDEGTQSSESFESGFVLFSENEQDFAYCDENINELVKKVRKLVIFLKVLSSFIKLRMQHFKNKLNLKKERNFH